MASIPYECYGVTITGWNVRPVESTEALQLSAPMVAADSMPALSDLSGAHDTPTNTVIKEIHGRARGMEDSDNQNKEDSKIN